MARYSRVFALAVWALVACDQGPGSGSSVPGGASAGQPLAASEPVRVSLLATRPGSGETRWLEHRLGAREPAVELGRLAHLGDGVVRGALVPGRQAVVAVAETDPRGDGSFGSALFLLEPGEAPRRLAEGCVHASRPLVEGSSVLVERGQAGSEPSAAAVKAGALRSDELEISRLDLESGELETLHAFTGYAAHLCGTTKSEAIVYRVSHGHADLVAVALEGGAVRVLADAIPAFARDFSVDRAASALVYTNRDAGGWIVERLELGSGARSTLARVGGMWAAPRVWPGGGVLLNDGRGGALLGGTGLERPLGPGFDVLEHVSADGRWAALSHRLPGALPVPFVAEVETGTVTLVPVEGGERAEIVGVSP